MKCAWLLFSCLYFLHLLFSGLTFFSIVWFVLSIDLDATDVKSRLDTHVFLEVGKLFSPILETIVVPS